MNKFKNIVKKIDKYFISDDTILSSIFSIIKLKGKNEIRSIRWISFSQFTDVKEIAKGGYEDYMLSYIIKIYGFTKDPESEDYVLVMKYAPNGDLHKYLQKNFTNITWNIQKLIILYDISMGLETIHNKKFMHRDFHSGNILCDSSSRYKIRLTFSGWIFRCKNKAEFIQAEEKRKKLIESKKIGPEFAKKRHSGAIYTSRPLSALISKCSSIYSSTISFGKQDSNYISELKDDKDTESLSSQNLNFAIQKFSTSLNSNYISEELEFDIQDNESSTIQNYSTTLDSSRYISAELELDINTESYSRYISTELELDINTESFRSQNLKKRRNEGYLNLETHDDSGKRIKTNFNYP
ncbi:kinase-like domain-containing protein [Rhizophagus irregularis DAOM 181602=DAOM 197198]|nr:kinase-like domain-containing protein [Rhizophagus irregularis DAOM 181602=DAOM 197198]